MTIQLDPKKGMPSAADFAGPTVKNNKGQEVVSGESQQTANTDSVKLTGHAQVLQNLAQSMRGEDGVDMQKVMDIQARLSSGEYVVDAEKIADKMLTMESEHHG